VYENGTERVVLAPNRALLEDVEVGVPGEFHIQRAGEDLQYWMLMPHLDGEHKVPVILDIHGGPSSQFSATLYYEHQVWSASGYAVVYGNPRGSHGYSDRFLRGAVGDFGGEDLQDVLAMLDDALAREPRLDGDRCGVTGFSYGGYMTNRAITVTNRFRAAVSGSGPTNLVSMAGTSDLGHWLSHIYQLGPAHKHLAHYIDRSPVFAADHVRTPLLIYQGADDPRVPATQAQEYVYALQCAGVEARALLLPGDKHHMIRRIGVGFGSPVHQRAIREATLDWFNCHLRRDND
jgi:dipeptidyl aminopeptidase/acylaminoacyl peptidase